MKRGEIWVVQRPEYPKPRPAVILSINPINELHPDVIVVPITGKPAPLRPHISEPFLDKASYVKCETVTAVYKGLLKQRLGMLSARSLATVEKGVKTALGLT